MLLQCHPLFWRHRRQTNRHLAIDQRLYSSCHIGMNRVLHGASIDRKPDAHRDVVTRKFHGRYHSQCRDRFADLWVNDIRQGMPGLQLTVCSRGGIWPENATWIELSSAGHGLVILLAHSAMWAGWWKVWLTG